MVDTCSETRTRENEELRNPLMKPYYLDSFGSKSIGEPEWRPHPRNALAVEGTQPNGPRGGNGLDWVSSLRCPPAEEYHKTTSDGATTADGPKEATCTGDTTCRNVPQNQLGTDQIPNITSSTHAQEMSDIDEDFAKIFIRRPLELTLEKALGMKKKVPYRRNDIGFASLGDKTYQVPEYAQGFHKHGSTLPVVHFGGSLKCVPDTFVPLQDLPLKPSQTFVQKERERRKVQEIAEVHELDSWQAAKVLTPALLLPLGNHT